MSSLRREKYSNNSKTDSLGPPDVISRDSRLLFLDNKEIAIAQICISLNSSLYLVRFDRRIIELLFSENLN